MIGRPVPTRAGLPDVDRVRIARRAVGNEIVVLDVGGWLENLSDAAITRELAQISARLAALCGPGLEAETVGPALGAIRAHLQQLTEQNAEVRARLAVSLGLEIPAEIEHSVDQHRIRSFPSRPFAKSLSLARPAKSQDQWRERLVANVDRTEAGSDSNTRERISQATSRG